jgi:HSP20 family protein
MNMLSIDQTINQLELLYRAVTGKDAPMSETPYAIIPPEKDPILHVEEQMERLNGMLGRIPSGSPTVTPPWAPPVFVSESPTEIMVCVDVPGVPIEGIEVVLSQNVLVISGNRPSPITNGAGAESRPRLVERPLGNFRRVLVLPTTAQASELSAQLKDGVMTIRIPRGTANSVIRPIQVK